MRGTTLCIISLMAIDRYVVWQELKEMEGREYTLNKNEKKTLFFNFCFLQSLLHKHCIKHA